MYDYIAVHLFIFGKVHGVFFRRHIHKIAVSLGLKGFVKNLADKRVEVAAEGKNESIDKLIEFCKKGPLLANTKGITIEYRQPEGKFKGFHIIY